MTYVVAWKHRDSVFIIADSATTRKNARSPSSPLSSFGEPHVVHSDGVIEESAFKLFRRKNVALAFAGDVAQILEFVRRLDRHLDRGMPAWAALVAAGRETKVEPNNSFEGVAAFRFLGGSRLSRLTKSGELVPSDDQVIHLGTPAPHLMSIVHTTIGDARRQDKSPDVQLACVLASCQGLTVQQGLLEQHAGGAFTGMIFDGRGGGWQPDVAYLVLDPDGFTTSPVLPPSNDVALYVSCVIRNDMLVVNSQTKAGTAGFLSPLSDLNDPAVLKLASEACQQADDTRTAFAFDFVTILSTRWHVTTVIETRKQSRTAAIQLSYDRRGEKPALVVRLNSQIASKLRGNPSEPNIPRIFFYDYRELAPDEVEAA